MAPVQKRFSEKIKEVTPVRLIAISFAVIIAFGTLFLLLPISSKSGSVSFINALFTSTSATCVTGLTPFDTFSQWTVFGQVIILILIQLGGLGLLTFTTGFTLLLRGRLGLRDIQLVKEQTSSQAIHIRQLLKMIFTSTFLCEMVGAILLCIRFVPAYGPKGIWISVFLAVSSYCNAGFDILGFQGPSTSLINFQQDPLVLGTISLLIILGGLGYVVVNEIYTLATQRIHGEKKGFHNFSLHSKVVLITTFVLIVTGTIGFLLLDYDASLKNLNFGDKLLNAYFQAVSARTAGYNSIDIASENPLTQCFTIVLMFIGASPVSTGGGIKTTTFIVILCTVWSVFSGREETTVFKRRVDKSIVYRSLAISLTAMMVVLITTGIIMSAENHNPDISTLDCLFEAVSAFGTVGVTTGITPHLSEISKLSIILTMFIGRVGPVSMALAFTMRGNKKPGKILPEGRIIVG